MVALGGLVAKEGVVLEGVVALEGAVAKEVAVLEGAVALEGTEEMEGKVVEVEMEGKVVEVEMAKEARAEHSHTSQICKEHQRGICFHIYHSLKDSN